MADMYALTRRVDYDRVIDFFRPNATTLPRDSVRPMVRLSMLPRLHPCRLFRLNVARLCNVDLHLRRLRLPRLVSRHARGLARHKLALAMLGDSPLRTCHATN
jgi:hypothetical protein